MAHPVRAPVHARTRLLVATEGILTARLQQDPLLSDFRTVVLDEFHERSIHADLGLALARQAWRARDDLRLVVMSATLEAGPVAAFLGGCPVVAVPGRTHALTIEYAPNTPVGQAVGGVLSRTDGSVLCFLPGAPEIRRALPDVRAAVPGADVVELHGSLDADAQDSALRPARGRRVILATNIAETSLTVPGVSAVVDTGLQKLPRYDVDRGFDHLRLERITQDSADQRAGRAGRLGPGVAVRLWNHLDRLRPHREPDISANRPRRAGARRAGLGRQPRDVRVVRSAAARHARRGAGATSSDWRRRRCGTDLAGPPASCPAVAPATRGGPGGGPWGCRGRTSLCASGRRPAREGGDGRHHVERRAARARHVAAAGAAAQAGGRSAAADRASVAQTRIDKST